MYMCLSRHCGRRKAWSREVVGGWHLSEFHFRAISRIVLCTLLLDGGAGEAEAYVVVTLNI